MREGASNQIVGVSDRYKINYLPGQQINDPSAWKHCSLPLTQDLLCLGLELIPLEELFELKLCSLNALNLGS